MIDHLNQEFVNVWTVREELDEIVADEKADRALRGFARVLIAKYQYPVDSQILTPDGKLLRQIATNDLIGARMDERYLEFLRKERK